MKDQKYHLFQTPFNLCIKLVDFIPIEPNDTVYEPFKGEGGFYNALLTKTEYVDWTEIEEGKPYQENKKEYDWIITNPPFRLDNKINIRENSFYTLLKELAPRCNKGIAFLGNDKCMSCLTPKRLKELEKLGLYRTKLITCNVKKWRGRYFFIVFTKIKNDSFGYLEENY